MFSGNTSIKTFDELPQFTNITFFVSRAFENCTGMEHLILPESIVNVNYSYVFRFCSAQFDINLPKATGTIGDDYFFSSGIKRVINLGNVDSINFSVFRNCKNLISVILPAELKHIKNQVFQDSTSLEWIKLLAANPPILDNIQAFQNSNDCSIYVPDESVEAYRTATNWSALSNRIKPLSEFAEE